MPPTHGKRFVAKQCTSSFRRESHFYNPDAPDRPVNSPKAVYQIEPATLELLRSFGTRSWKSKLEKYLESRPMLAERYAKARRGQRIPVQIAPGKEITLTPGEHSKLIQAIIEEFGPCFVPGGELIYAGDTSEKWGYFDEAKLKSLGVTVDAHGKMPDAVLYCPKRKWLLLIEAVTSHGPVDGKRHEELAKLFSASKAGLIYVTAFPNRTPMGRNLDRPDDRSCIATRSRVIVALPLVSGRTPIDPAAADAAFRRS